MKYLSLLLFLSVCYTDTPVVLPCSFKHVPFSVSTKIDCHKDVYTSKKTKKKNHAVIHGAFSSLTCLSRATLTRHDCLFLSNFSGVGAGNLNFGD